jgi:thiamine biosynthesis lipoprotein
LGTTWSVRWDGDSSQEDAVAESVVAALMLVDGQMSTWRSDSELSAIRGSSEPVAVSEATAAVVREALWLSEQTEGAFDPTVQPLVELWGFHGMPLTVPPTEQEITAARSQVGWQRVQVSHVDGQAVVNGGGTALDLSAIAKGYAVDRVSQAISELGVGSHLVEIGGEIRVSGPGPAEGLWTVGVEAPLPGNIPGSALFGVVQTVNASVATSGNYRQSRTVGGVEVHHTLDPRTGRPATSGVGSATVIAPTCSLADGLATALMVLGEEGLPLIERMEGVEAGLIWVDASGSRTEETSGFRLQVVTELIQPGASGHQ